MERVGFKKDYDFVKVEYKDVPINDLLESAGLNDDGLIQTSHTRNVLHRIQRYMPYKSGALIKLTILQTDIRKSVIVTRAPQAHYLYKGKVYVDSVTGKGPPVIPDVGPRWRKGAILKPTDRDLKYNTEKNERAGPQWDERLIEHEGKAIANDLQSFVDLQARRNK